MRAFSLFMLVTTGCAFAVTPDGSMLVAIGAAKAHECQKAEQAQPTYQLENCVTADSLGVSENFVELFRQLVQLPGRVAGAVLP